MFPRTESIKIAIAEGARGKAVIINASSEWRNSRSVAQKLVEGRIGVSPAYSFRFRVSGSIFLHGDNNSGPLAGARVTHTRNNYATLGKRWN